MQVEEYESDSDDSDNDVDIESEELVIGKFIMTRSGRQVKVWTRFDVSTCAKMVNQAIQTCYDSYRIVSIYKQTNKHVQLNILVTQVTCTYMYLVCFPFSNLKLYLIFVFVMFFYCSKSIKVI